MVLAYAATFMCFLKIKVGGGGGVGRCNTLLSGTRLLQLGMRPQKNLELTLHVPSARPLSPPPLQMPSYLHSSVGDSY